MIRLCALVIAALIVCAPASAQPSGPAVLLVNPKSGVKTLADFVAWGKRSSRPLAYSSSGLNSDGHRLGEAFAKKLGIKVVHVPYRAASQALLDLVGGHIDFSVMNLIAATLQIRGGLLTAVAIAAPRRAPNLPDVPTFAESGYPEFVWRDGRRMSARSFPNFIMGCAC